MKKGVSLLADFGSDSVSRGFGTSASWFRLNWAGELRLGLGREALASDLASGFRPGVGQGFGAATTERNL